ncbi:MAG: class I SAM-dependent methyltransferase [Oscillatoriales cyanobacterium SM2_1_8]|nr:class I SAM-dependent methyltransferase [Oscillatoriales cyanobacterium SM2_1_8]
MFDPQDLIRQTYEDHPYQGAVPLDVGFRQDAVAHFPFAAAIPFYLRDRRVPTAPLDILDVGCGAGVTTLLLAEANPGGRLVAIDLSAKSVQRTVERLQTQGYAVEGRVLALEAIPELGRQFDYINVHEVLYLLTDPGLGLQRLAAALKPGGILRANLHSVHARAPMYRAQTLMALLGWMDTAPTPAAYTAIRDWMGALRDDLPFKQAVWRPARAHDPDYLNNNFLFHGDKGFTVPQLFDFLSRAGLHFLGMVDRRGWDVSDWLTPPIPNRLAEFLANASTMDQLHAHDLLVGNHRLLDFWASPVPKPAAPEPAAWSEERWSQTWVALNPILRVEPLAARLQKSLIAQEPLTLADFLPQTVAATAPAGWIPQLCLRCLWENNLPASELALQVAARLSPPAEMLAVRRALQKLEKTLAVFLTMP